MAKKVGSCEVWGGGLIGCHSSGQGEFGVVQREYSQFEMFVISVAVGSSLENANLIVDSFEGFAGNAVGVPVE